ncbi:hypothetical protein ACRAWD_23130 [Caulobacter segnis]
MQAEALLEQDGARARLRPAVEGTMVPGACAAAAYPDLSTCRGGQC